MLREKFKFAFTEERKIKQQQINKMIAMLHSPKLKSAEDKKFLEKEIERLNQEIKDENLEDDFEQFNGGLDYYSRNIDLLVELKHKARKALEVLKKIDKSKENLSRE